MQLRVFPMKSNNNAILLCSLIFAFYTPPALAKNWAEAFEEQSHRNIDKFDQLLRKGGSKVYSTINQGLANAINPHADKKNAQIDFENGLLYYSRQNYESAFQSWESAAHLGHSSAQYNLAFLYAKGLGTPENKVKAFEWFLKSALQGLASAQYITGLNYLNGYGTEVNEAEAFIWFTQSASQNNSDAQFYLSKMYMSGKGTSANMMEAMKWMKTAAALGHEKAKYNLEFMNNLKFASGSVIYLDDLLKQ